MQEYYLKHRGPKTCPTCTLQFVCPRALQRRLSQNVSCLLTRVSHILEQLQQGHPEAHITVSSALRPELVRMQIVTSRPQKNRKADEGKRVAENGKGTIELKETQESEAVSCNRR